MDRKARAIARRIPPLLARRVRQFVKQLPGALRGDEEAIHEVRVAARRLRAVLPLLADNPEGQRVRRARRRLRRLTRAFGESRDLDVGLPLLQARVDALAASSRTGTLLVSRLARARTRAQRDMNGTVAALDLPALRRNLRAIVKGSAPSARALERLTEAREERSRELRGLLATQAKRFDAEALHHIRIRARRLRYVAEALDTLHARKSTAPALLRDLQDQLGLIHDAHVLAAWLGTQALDLAQRKERAQAAEARALSRYFHAQSRKLHREFLATKPAATVRRAAAIMRSGEPDDKRSKGKA